MQTRLKMVNNVDSDLKRLYGKMAASTWKKMNSKKIVSKYNYISFRKKYYENIYQIFSKTMYKEKVIVFNSVLC
jgi:hypothetical protein